MTRLALFIFLLVLPLAACSQVSPDVSAPAETAQDEDDLIAATVLQQDAVENSVAETLTVTGLPQALMNVDYQGTDIHLALKSLFTEAKIAYILDTDIPDSKVTLKLAPSKLKTILDILTDTAKVGWRLENRDGTPVIHVGKRISRGNNIFLYAAGARSVTTTRCSIDCQGLDIKDALKRILNDAKVQYALDNDIPPTPLTLHVDNIMMPVLLDMITESAGVGWKQERNGREVIYHVGKTVTKDTTLPLIWDPTARFNHTNTYLNLNQVFERRANFTCPHCKGQVTMIRTGNQPKCPTCGRIFQRDWKFCPFDSTKRPPSSTDWHFCPICGKAISMESAVKEDLNNSVSFPFNVRVQTVPKRGAAARSSKKASPAPNEKRSEAAEPKPSK